MTMRYVVLGGLTLALIQRIIGFSRRRRLKRQAMSELLPEQDDKADFQQRIKDYHSNLGDFEFGRELGRGSFGRVVEARWKGCSVAVKVMDHQSSGYASNNSVSKEAMIALASVHPNVVPVYEILTSQLPDDELDIAAFNLRTYIIMERADRGSLETQCDHLYNSYQEEPERGLLKILRCLMDVTFALEYLHGIGVTHGDLKPANVLCKSVSSDARGFVCKVCDFGLASSSSSDLADLLRSSKTARGGLLFLCLQYASPERLAGETAKSPSDVYAFGTLAWQLIALKDPQFEMRDASVAYQVTVNGWLPETSSVAPQPYRDFVEQCWQSDPEKRPNAKKLRQILTAYLKEVVRDSKLSNTQEPAGSRKRPTI